MSLLREESSNRNEEIFNMNANRILNDSKEVWIGLVGIRPKQECALLSKDAKGAYVNILTWAENSSEYRSEIEKAVMFYGCELFEIEDPEPLATRLNNNLVDNELLRLAEEVKTTRQIRFGTFHEYSTHQTGSDGKEVR